MVTNEKSEEKNSLISYHFIPLDLNIIFYLSKDAGFSTEENGAIATSPFHIENYKLTLNFRVMLTLDIRYLIQAKRKAGYLGKSTTQTVDPRKTAQGVTLILTSY